MATIVDSWLHKGRTAVYCSGDNVQELASRKKVNIADESFAVIGHDILTSISGKTNVMLLLDTQKEISVPQAII